MKVIAVIIKGIIRFFDLILNYKSKYDRKNLRYKGKSFARKVFLIIEMFAIPLIVLAFGLFFIPKCQNNVFAAIASILGYIILGIATVEFLIMNSILGFRNMFVSTIEEKLKSGVKKVINQNIEITENGIDIKEDSQQIEVEQTNELDNNQKRCRKVDLLIGILGIVLTVAFIALAIFIGSKTIA